MPTAQLDPLHEADARFFKCDRSYWKGGPRSARFTNPHCRRPSAPLRKMTADPVQRGGHAPERMSAFSRHVSIMHLLSLRYEKREAGFWCLTWSLEDGLTWVNVIHLVSDEASLSHARSKGLARRTPQTCLKAPAHRPVPGLSSRPYIINEED